MIMERQGEEELWKKEIKFITKTAE